MKSIDKSQKGGGGYGGKNRAANVALPEAVGEQAVDGALITSPANRLYLTGMETSAGYVLVTRREAYFIVDFRYYEAACKQVSHCKVVEFSKIGETLKELARQEGLKGILLEYEGISLSSAQQMETIFPCGWG